jgi:hypothetical protein
MASTHASSSARAGTVHKKLHVNFSISLAYTFKTHLDIFIFL